jgi:hypothetical protein
LFAACGGEESTFGNTEGSGASGNGTAAGGGPSGGGATTGGMGTGGEPPPECPHTGPDVIDPTALPECPTSVCAGGARCLPSTLIPVDLLDQLADCDASNKCVPDDFIKTNGQFIAPSCDSVAGAEGRCLSECIPQVSAQLSLLPQGSCPAFQRCVPCYDPVTLMDTGACSLSCDPGPTDPPVALPSCCEGVGTCIPEASVPPAQAGSLPQDTCPDDPANYLCVPSIFITDPNFSPPACLTDIFLFGGEPGVCLPDCLVTGFTGSLLGQSTCAGNEKCAPCEDPLGGGPTGACDL